MSSSGYTAAMDDTTVSSIMPGTSEKINLKRLALTIVVAVIGLGVIIYIGAYLIGTSTCRKNNVPTNTIDVEQPEELINTSRGNVLNIYNDPSPLSY